MIAAPDYSYKLFNSITQVESDWQSLIPIDEYWQASYHLALENSLPKDLKPFYVIVYFKSEPVGIIYLQWKRINLKESIRFNNTGFLNSIKRFFLNFLRNNTLVIGNLLLTGKYGFHFNNEIDIKKQLEIVNGIAESICNDLKPTVNFRTILFKDFFEPDVVSITDFDNYTKFSVQPNMMLEIRENWNTKDDYVEDLKSKARIRYKRTISKLSPLTARELDYDEIVNHKTSLKNLYLTIANNASFNLFYLGEDYFPNLKKYMGSTIKLIGYFDHDHTLKGFYTIIKNHDHLDAHFLGYDGTCNKENLLYLNMLFDMVTNGIDLGVSKICMSRTAVEIKSSVGAYPVKMYCFLKHRNRFLNKLVSPFINYLYQDEKWIERNPFK